MKKEIMECPYCDEFKFISKGAFIKHIEICEMNPINMKRPCIIIRHKVIRPTKEEYDNFIKALNTP